MLLYIFIRSGDASVYLKYLSGLFHYPLVGTSLKYVKLAIHALSCIICKRKVENFTFRNG